MKKRRFIIILAVLLCCYITGPYLAGSFRIGDRLGPIIYQERFHETLYILGHEASHNEKPRPPLDTWMYRRPIFYGLSRRLRSEQERQDYIEETRRGNIQSVEWWLTNMNANPERQVDIELVRQSKNRRLEELIRMNQEVEGKSK
jgi:hypothetical protein